MPSIRGEQVVSDRIKFLEINNDLNFRSTEQKYRVNQQTDNIRYNLIVAALEHGLILIGLPDKTVIGVSTNKLQKSNSTPDLNNVLFTLPLSFEPALLSVSRHGFGSVLLVAGKNKEKNCPVVQFFSLNTRESIAVIDLLNQTNSDIIETEWNPIYHDSIVALCSSSGTLLVIAVNTDLKRAALVYQESKYGVLSCSWSPKGRNLAIGMSNGQIMRLEPDITESSFTFKDVNNSAVNPVIEALSPQHRLVKLDWVRRKILLCIYAKPINPDGPGTVYSLVSIKASDPLIYWSSVCSERSDSNYSFYSANLNNIIICSSSCSSEVVVLAPRSGESGADKIPDWSSVTIDEEGCRIDLPLDSQYNSTYPLGFAVAMLNVDSSRKPIIIFYTTQGLVTSYICDSTIPLDLPTLLESQACPINIPEPIMSQPLMPTPTQAPSPAPALTPVKVAEIPKPAPLIKQKEEIHYELTLPDITSIKEGIQFNSVYLTLLDDINHIRSQLDEIIDIHKMHTDALETIRDDIDTLDLGMLENFYLLEFIKSRSKNSTKKSLDPLTSKRLETVKKKMKTIEKKLEDLELQVDVSWEDHIRRTKKKPALNSLDIIYKSLSTNQKILNLLKKKAATTTIQSETTYEVVQEVNQLDPVKMKGFREFLAARNTVPVRRPIKLK